MTMVTHNGRSGVQRNMDHGNLTGRQLSPVEDPMMVVAEEHEEENEMEDSGDGRVTMETCVCRDALWLCT